MKTNSVSNLSFNGLTKIYAIADTHQDSRKTASFLSKIIRDVQGRKDVLFLHCGDMFKGIYPREIEADCYMKMQEAVPDVEMVMTLGNNDFGFNQAGFEFLINTAKKFAQKGIKIVSANIFDKSGNRPDWIKPYVIVNRDGDKNFITGFCTNELGLQGTGYIKSKEQIQVLDEIVANINKENPDNIIILNHDFMPFSKKIIDYLKEKRINVDLLIGGHDHAKVKPDDQLRIYYPEVYANTMYTIDLVNNHGEKQLKNVIRINNDSIENIALDTPFKKAIESFENSTGLFDVICKSVLDLPFIYSKPSPYGTFFADSMKKSADADIGFVSTGFILESLNYRKGGYITNYDVLHTMPTKTPIRTVELTAEELREVFNHAFKKYGKNEPNTRFLQCSSNLKITGKRRNGNFEVEQIFIDKKPILNVPNKDKKYKCAIDTYISNGGQDFIMIKNKKSQDVFVENKLSDIGEELKKSLIEAQYKYLDGFEYPTYQIEIA